MCIDMCVHSFGEFLVSVRFGVLRTYVHVYECSGHVHTVRCARMCVCTERQVCMFMGMSLCIPKQMYISTLSVNV